MILTRPEPDAVRQVVANLRENDYREAAECSPLPMDHPREEIEQEMIATFSQPGGITYLGWHENEPVAVGGFAPFWQGTLVAWMVGTERMNDCILSATRTAKRYCEEVLSIPGIHRLQAYSADFHDESHAWLEALGFKREGTMEKLGQSGADFYLYAKTRS